MPVKNQEGGSTPSGASMNGGNASEVPGSSTPWGIGPFDQRLGGLTRGGTYILAGLPGSGRLIALLQFLSAGLPEGRVGLVTAASQRRVFEESTYWGLGLEEAWKEDRVGLLSFKGDFQRRLLSAADPSEMLDEMAHLLGPDIQRLALYPATPLWETRAGTGLSSMVAGWLEALPATTMAAVGGDLESTTTPATDWMLDAATGVFLLSRDAEDRPHLRIRRMSPPVQDPGAITLELVPGAGFSAPLDGPARRQTDHGAANSRKVILFRLAPDIPAEVTGWLERWYEPSVVENSRELLEELNEERAGMVLVYTGREQVDDAIHTVRAVRQQSGTPVIVATGDRIRASDRIRAVEAGASDFLSDPLSVGELASRTERAMIAGAPPRNTDAGQKGQSRLEGGRVSNLPDLILERLSHPRHSLFTLVELQASGLSERKAVLDAVSHELRAEDGDLAGELPDGVGVILQGTQVEGANAFLDRVRGRLGESGNSLEARVLSGTADTEAIRSLVPAEQP